METEGLVHVYNKISFPMIRFTGCSSCIIYFDCKKSYVLYLHHGIDQLAGLNASTFKKWFCVIYNFTSLPFPVLFPWR